MEVIIFSRDEERIADLNPESIKDPLVIEDKEGLMNLHFSYSVEEEDSQSLQGGNYAAFFDDDEGIWKVYEIINIAENDQFIQVQGAHRYEELATEELVSWNTNGDNADIAMTHTLAGTRYQVGIVENTRALKRSVYEKNPLESLRYIEREWGGVLRPRIELSGSGTFVFYMDLLERRGEFKGDRFEFGHNLKEFEHTVDFGLIKTAMYGRGKGAEIEGEDTAALTFTDYEWSVANGDPVDKPIGQDWIGLEDKRLQYGKPDGNGGRKHAFGRYDSQAETAEGLIWETYFKLLEASEPLVNVRAAVVDMAQYSSTFIHEKAFLGDEVYIIAEYKGRRFEILAEIIRVEKNPDDPSDKVIEMGNFLPIQSKRLAEIEKDVSLQQARAGIYERAAAITPDGKVPTSILSGVIDAIQNEVHSAKGFVYHTDEGILILNGDRDATDPNLQATNAMLLSGGAFYLANSRNEDGSWNWRTFGDGEGFIATELISGSIKTDLIEIFGNTHFKWNGDNIYILDPNDSLKQIRIGKYNGVEYGIGYTKDGGETWNTALDFDGFSLTFDMIGGLTEELDNRDEGLTEKFKDGGGVNILRNSTGTAEYDFWTTNNSSRITTTSNDALASLGLPTGFYFPEFGTTGDRYIYQEVDVIPNEPYTISWYINKLNGAAADGTTKQDFVVQIIDPSTGSALTGAALWQKESTNGYERKFFTFTPTIDRIRVRVFGYYAAEGTVAGLMLNKGTNPYQWTMANGELYNTNVHFDINGIKVIQKADNKEIQRTVMTPDKFAGYYDTNADGVMDTANGSVDEVFRMDKDEFVMKKATVREEITMGQVKIIKVNASGKNGWAFVPITE